MTCLSTSPPSAVTAPLISFSYIMKWSAAPAKPTLDIDAKPKMIKRLAQQHEVMETRDEEGLGDEATAKLFGAWQAADHKLPIEILDAKYQA